MEETSREIFKVVIAGTLIILILGVCIVAFVILFRQKQSMFKKEKYQMKLEFEQALLHTQLEIQEQTLHTISQEIHDNIGQTLSLAKLNLNTMDMENGVAKEQKIVSTKKLVGKAITDLRSLSKTLNSDSILSSGLLDAVEYELAIIRKSGTMQAFLQKEGIVKRLNPQKELILFRIIQQSLNNIIKHSEATSVIIQATYRSDSLQIIIKDDGKGFALSSIGNGMDSGSGLRNMKNRAALINAQIDISSISGEGTLTTITLLTNEA